MVNKITEEAAWDILHAPVDASIPELAARWGVSEQTVRIVKRQGTDQAVKMVQWMQAAGHQVNLLPPAKRERAGALTDDQVRYVRKNTSINSKAMAKQIGCSSSLVRMIRTGQAYVSVKD